jgi:hypothetical protein
MSLYGLCGEVSRFCPPYLCYGSHATIGKKKIPLACPVADDTSPVSCRELLGTTRTGQPAGHLPLSGGLRSQTAIAPAYGHSRNGSSYDRIEQACKKHERNGNERDQHKCDPLKRDSQDIGYLWREGPGVQNEWRVGFTRT